MRRYRLGRHNPPLDHTPLPVSLHEPLVISRDKPQEHQSPVEQRLVRLLRPLQMQVSESLGGLFAVKMCLQVDAQALCQTVPNLSREGGLPAVNNSCTLGKPGLNFSGTLQDAWKRCRIDGRG